MKKKSDVKENTDVAVASHAAKDRPKLDRIQTSLASVKSLVDQLQKSPGDQALVSQIQQKVDEVSTDAQTFATPA